MSTLYVRDIPDRLYRQARKIAQAQGRSLSAFVVMALEQALADEKIRQQRTQAISTIRRRRRALPAEAPDSVSMLRKIRAQDE
jgi:hypothetical protein